MHGRSLGRLNTPRNQSWTWSSLAVGEGKWSSLPGNCYLRHHDDVRENMLEHARVDAQSSGRVRGRGG